MRGRMADKPLSMMRVGACGLSSAPSHRLTRTAATLTRTRTSRAAVFGKVLVLTVQANLQHSYPSVDMCGLF